MIETRPLAPNLSISAKIAPEDVPALAAAGFRSIICNRPDGEDPGQPDWAEIASAAEAAGIEARHIPVVPGAIGEDAVTAFSSALEEMPGPVLAFCRTGGRAASLWGLSQAGRQEPDQIIASAAAAGCDISALRERLARN